MRNWGRRGGNFTWRHIESGSTSKIRGVVVGCGEPKVSEFDGHSMVGDQDILWLEVPMIDSNGMAKLDGIQNLEKSPLGKGIVPYIMPSFRNIGK